MTAPHRPGRIRVTDLAFLFILVASIVVVMIIRGGGGAAPEDVARGAANFEDITSFADARDAAQASGKPVFVLASADWCPPCQQLKATTLADADVMASLDAAVVSYHLDVTDSSAMSTEDASLAQSLGVRSIPALYIVTPNGEATASIAGYRSKDEFLGWLERSVN